MVSFTKNHANTKRLNAKMSSNKIKKKSKATFGPATFEDN